MMRPMDRREFLGTAAIGVTAAIAACRREPPRRQPNVIFIITDDQRWDCLGCAGHPYLKTPNMDRVANEGVRFANMFCTDSLCSPSRASFLSGQYAHTHGVRNNFTEYPDNLPSYPKALKAAGYTTAYVGKWHMGENNDEHRSGFDYWASHKGQGQYYGTEWNIQGKRQKLDGYYTHIVTDLAVDWMKTAKRPFAIEVGHKAPHGIWVPEPKYAHAFDSMPIDRPATATLPPGTPDWVSKRIKTWHGIDGPLYETNDYGVFRRSYLATLLSVDDAVGRVFDVLNSIGELDNTVIAYAGDNGFLLGEHASIDKRTAWEESMRIPLLLRYPEVVKSPHVVSEMVLNMDLAPSLVDIGGGIGFPKVAGASFVPLLRGEHPATWRKSFLYEYNFEKEFPYTPNVRAVRTDDWKYIHYPNGGANPDTEKAELYHVAIDPIEAKNLIDDPASQPKLAELRAELDRLLKETGVPTPDPMPENPQLSFAMPEKSIR
jgi:N-acetylglucosamine-6-sulfatase